MISDKLYKAINESIGNAGDILPFLDSMFNNYEDVITFCDEMGLSNYDISETIKELYLFRCGIYESN